jgi:hypothetical protein
MNTRTIIAAAAIAAAGASSVALSACGSSGPANATSILQSNGYTPVSLSSLGGSASDLTSAFPAGDVASFAVGDNSSGEYQFVVVTTPQGQTDIASTGDVSNEESQVAAAGGSMTYSGGVVTLTGTISQFDNLGS